MKLMSSRFAVRAIAVYLLLLTGTSACSSSTAVIAKSNTCPAPASGEAWQPDVAGLSDSNHDSTSAVYVNQYTKNGSLLTGLTQSLTAGHVVEISGIDMNEDLLAKGSISLVAEISNLPGGLSDAWPVLVSLHDGTNELVNVTGCDSGFYTCSSSGCSPVSTCGPGSATAFLGDTATERKVKWEQAQMIANFGVPVSVNSFPTCNWASTSPSCPFTSGANFFAASATGDRLKSGTTYTAKYVLLANTSSDLGNSYRADLKLKVIRKKDAASAGAVDLNVVLVGSENIRDARTKKGKQNLNALFEHVVTHFDFTGVNALDPGQANPGIKLGQIRVYDWDCANGGDAYSTVDVNDTGKLFKTASSLLPSDTESRAVNIFLVSNIDYQDGTGTVLGLAGGIPGAMVNGTAASGIVVSTFGKLDTYNPDCSVTGVCGSVSQEESFINLASTVSHEMGHFIGLSHLSEGFPLEGSATRSHDRVPDTPSCTSENTDGYLTRDSCWTECRAIASCAALPCPEVSQCQFNHVMWWTTKDYSAGVGDGNLFSPDSSTIMNYSPYVQ